MRRQDERHARHAGPCCLNQAETTVDSSLRGSGGERPTYKSLLFFVCVCARVFPRVLCYVRCDTDGSGVTVQVHLLMTLSTGVRTASVWCPV